MGQLIFSTNTAASKQLSRKTSNGQLIRVYKGIYTDAQHDEIPSLIDGNWADIVSYLQPNCILAYRTAFEMRPVNGHVFVVADVKSRFKIHVSKSLTINVLPGNTSLMTTRLLIQLRNSNFSRQLLENLSPSRKSKSIEKSLGKHWVEEQLVKILKKRGEDELNLIRDEARSYSSECGLADMFNELNTIISALLTSHPIEGVLESDIAISKVSNTPYDVDRVNLFKSLADYLLHFKFDPISYQYSSSSWRNLSFFESYFSNYIEGTEFEIDEAESIIFAHTEIKGRHVDSHDISSIFDQVSDYQEMSKTPDSAEAFVDELRQRHLMFMQKRQDKNPGQLKAKPNKAGSTTFVSPEETVGTLIKGFEICKSLPPGLSRAIFVQFLVSECHPFDDGNGRLSRIMMNAELHAVDQYKIIVPTVHRESYLNGLRLASREGKFKTLVKVFYQLQCYTSSLDWNDYGEVRDQIELHKAHLSPDEGVADFNRQIRKFKFSSNVL